MIVTLLVILVGLLWLGYETDWLRARLPIGKATPPPPARYRVFNSLKTRKHYDGLAHEGSNNSDNLGPEYNIVFSPGVTEPLCGYAWLDKHCGDLVNYHPNVYLAIAGVRYNMTVKQPAILGEVMKVNKLTKRELREYAATAA